MIKVGDLVWFTLSGIRCYGVVHKVADPYIEVYAGYSTHEVRQFAQSKVAEGLYSLMIDDARLVEVPKPKPEPVGCQEPTLDLFKFGCRCGAIKRYGS